MARTAGEFLRRRSLETDRSSKGSGELHVLAVDDSHVDRKMIERLLNISSCRVTAVESGTRALQYLGLEGERSSVGLDGLNVNLIMTDYSMPGMTGYELLKKIKESSALREIPVVIMSSENILTRIDRCLEEGAEDFLLKPVKLSDVKRLKDFILRGQGEENEERTSQKRKVPDDSMPLSPLIPLSSPPPPPPGLPQSLARDQSSISIPPGLPQSLARDQSSISIPSSSMQSIQPPSKLPRLCNVD